VPAKQKPFWHPYPAGQVTLAQAGSTQVFKGPQACPAGQFPEPHCVLTHTPSEQTLPDAHITPTQRVSTQTLLMQT
jgi:hypothetical protein